MLYTREPQDPEVAESNSVVSIRGSVTPSAISDDYAPTLRVSEVANPCSSSRNSPTSLGGTAALFTKTLDDSSNMSEDMSTITLPSFVEQERPSSIPSPALALAVLEGARSFPSSSRFSFQPPRSRSMIVNTTAPITPSSVSHFDSPISSTSMPDWSSDLHRTRSFLSRRAGVRRELVTTKLRSVAQAEVVKTVQPGTPEISGQPSTDGPHRGTLSRLTIPNRTHSFPGNCFGDRRPYHEERDLHLVPYNYLRPVSLRPPPRKAWPALTEPEGTPPAFSMNNTAEPPSPYQSPVLGFFNSPRSYTITDEGRSRVTSQTASSVSTVPSISAFPPPPDFAPELREKALSIVSNYSASGQPFLPTMLRKSISVGGAETSSPNKGQVSTPLPDANPPRLMSTTNSRTVHLHSEFMSGDSVSSGSGASSRVSSMRRLSRVPLGPRQMSNGTASLRNWICRT